MNDFPQWTIEDLMARYELEPELRDVFVEGNFDQDVLLTCFKLEGDTERICYPINSVNISNDILAKYNLTDGNKQRVTALALELANAIEIASCRCLVDSDLDHWISSDITAKYLVRTKYSSLDLYFFSEDFLKRLLLTAARVSLDDWQTFFSSFIEVLKDLYALRLVDRELKLHLTWTLWSKCLKRNKNSINFDVNDYINRVLLSNSKAKSAEAFVESYKTWRAKLVVDPRLCIRGHDFVELISWVVGKFAGRKDFATPDAIEGLFLLAAEEAAEILEIL